MSKPDWCPQDVWDEAEVVAKEATRDAMRDPLMPYFVTVSPHIARAILSAEKRGEEREREGCAKLADDIGAGRSRQCSEAKTAKKRTEARDFESMAMSAIDVGYAIRKRGA